MGVEVANCGFAWVGHVYASSGVERSAAPSRHVAEAPGGAFALGSRSGRRGSARVDAGRGRRGRRGSCPSLGVFSKCFEVLRSASECFGVLRSTPNPMSLTLHSHAFRKNPILYFYVLHSKITPAEKCQNEILRLATSGNQVYNYYISLFYPKSITHLLKIWGN